ncbi:MAG: endolytic transglycosylase MltG [Gammaproteobacteria bacterium]|nr:endolytic transglycosylase MltG [Gammaproteobacteria bacterium]
MRRLITWTVLLFLVIALCAAWWLWSDFRRSLRAPLNITGPEILIIEPGTALGRIARDLARRGWLERSHYFELEGRRLGLARSIKAGEYAVAPGTTPLDLLALLVSGRVVHHSLTLLEGWTFEQIMLAVAANDWLEHTLKSHHPRHVMSEIGYAGHFAEGRLFPDTYLFPAGTSDVEFLRRAYETMESVLSEEWSQRREDLPYEGPYQALIMASLIEKETAVAKERGRIAGIFVRRVQRGIKLQTDPSIIYALGTSFDGNLRRADLALDSPYNSYLHKGLPPTPIASPGRASIRAALQPEDTDDLYFVARGDGSHEFSRTLTEHNQAVKKYQLEAR